MCLCVHRSESGTVSGVVVQEDKEANLSADELGVPEACSPFQGGTAKFTWATFGGLYFDIQVNSLWVASPVVLFPLPAPDSPDWLFWLGLNGIVTACSLSCFPLSPPPFLLSPSLSASISSLFPACPEPPRNS